MDYTITCCLIATKDNQCEDKIFTAKEITLFKTRFEEGYDITDDERYNEWLKQQGI